MASLKSYLSSISLICLKRRRGSSQQVARSRTTESMGFWECRDLWVTSNSSWKRTNPRTSKWSSRSHTSNRSTTKALSLSWWGVMAYGRPNTKLTGTMRRWRNSCKTRKTRSKSWRDFSMLWWQRAWKEKMALITWLPSWLSMILSQERILEEGETHQRRRRCLMLVLWFVRKTFNQSDHRNNS
jgi:hypothetical protein